MESWKIPTPTTGEISLYIHLPFCKRKCPYCHFYVIPYREKDADALLEAILAHFSECDLQGKKVISIYFGGGTPYLFGPKRIAALLQHFPPAEEITLEANPEDLDFETLKAYRQAGVNRLSIGVQSFDDAELKRLGRNHSAKQCIDGVLLAKEAGFSNISIDLMYDIPSQVMDAWEKSVAVATTLPITHLSLYNLTIEPHTLFFKKRDTLSFPSEEESLASLQYAVRSFAEHGLKRYEISAFAKKGYYSKHNSGYWNARPFLGLGPSAFSYYDKKRFRNHAHLGRYLREKKRTDFEETLAADAQVSELLILELRLLQGVDLPLFEKRHGKLDPTTWKTLHDLLSNGYLGKEKNQWHLSEKGFLFYDFVATELVHC